MTGENKVRGTGAIVFAVAFLISAVVVLPAGGSAKSWYPKEWDEQVAPIAAKVAKFRGMPFKHPVKIVFLNEAEFEKDFEVDEAELSVQDKELAAQGAAMFRALGLVGGKVDMLKAMEQTQISGVLAYYDHEREEIVVRGTKLDASHRVTLAHELTHVLQDQYLDLDALGAQADESEIGDEGAYRGLVEGDANRIEHKFEDQMPAKEKAAYERQQAKDGADFDKDIEGVPPVFPLLFGAPYIFGPTTIQILDKTGGNEAIDTAISGPTPTSRLFTEPAQLDNPEPPGRPAAPDDAEVLDESSFGPFEAYLTLGMHLSPVRALAAADAIDSGRAVTYKEDGKVCVRAAFSPRSKGSPEFLRAAFTEWAGARTGARVTKDDLGFVACDPGTKVAPPSKQLFDDLTRTLVVRNSFTAGLVDEDQKLPFARCAARMWMAYPGMAEASVAAFDREFNAAEQQLAREAGGAAGTACREDPNSGLP
jgi:hypothetical protein